MPTAIYPGTFDPVTRGHVDVVERAVLIREFAAQRGAAIVVRGLRTSDDIPNELAMAATNRTMSPDLQTIFLPASEGYDHISSTIDVSGYTKEGR